MKGLRKSTIVVIISIMVIIGLGFTIYNQINDEIGIQENVDINCKENTTPVCIGVILPLSGDLSSHGKENWKSMEFAEKEFNKKLKSEGGIKIKLYQKDSATNPIIALEQIKKHRAQGINIILGLESSENISNVIEYATKNDMVLLSCCSSAVHDSLQSKNLFRLVPDDSKQGAVLAELLHDDGIKRVIPVYRDDIWGNSLYNQIKMNFEEYGLIVNGTYYHPNSPSSIDISKLNKKVGEQIQDIKPENIAILFLSFKEISLFMELAEKTETNNLVQVPWYGPGAITKERGIENNLQFSQKINLTTVQVAPSTNTDTLQERTAIRGEFLKEPSSFVYSSYDTVMIIGEAIQQTNGKTDFNSISTALRDITTKHEGTIGPTKLNHRGDLAQANYTVWKFQEGDWTPIGHYYINEIESDQKWKFKRK